MIVSIAGANRDPAVFPDPDRFDVRRENAKLHAAFAGGPHVCIGMHLARLEAAGGRGRDARAAAGAGARGRPRRARARVPQAATRCGCAGRPRRSARLRACSSSGSSSSPSASSSWSSSSVLTRRQTAAAGLGDEAPRPPASIALRRTALFEIVAGVIFLVIGLVS